MIPSNGIHDGVTIFACRNEDGILVARFVIKHLTDDYRAGIKSCMNEMYALGCTVVLDFEDVEDMSMGIFGLLHLMLKSFKESGRHLILSGVMDVHQGFAVTKLSGRKYLIVHTLDEALRLAQQAAA